MATKLMFYINIEKHIQKNARPGYTFDQQALSREVGLSGSAISRMRRGPISRVNGNTLKLLADYFGVKPKDLLEFREVTIEEAEALGE